jgi:hypothetical protein
MRETLAAQAFMRLAVISGQQAGTTICAERLKLPRPAAPGNHEE